MRVLITGGAGFLRSHLSDAFIARGDEVFVLDTGSIAKVRPDQKVVLIRDWDNVEARLKGLAATMIMLAKIAEEGQRAAA